MFGCRKGGPNNLEHETAWLVCHIISQCVIKQYIYFQSLGGHGPMPPNTPLLVCCTECWVQFVFWIIFNIGWITILDVVVSKLYNKNSKLQWYTCQKCKPTQTTLSALHTCLLQGFDISYTLHYASFVDMYSVLSLCFFRITNIDANVKKWRFVKWGFFSYDILLCLKSVAS